VRKPQQRTGRGLPACHITQHIDCEVAIPAAQFVFGLIDLALLLRRQSHYLEGAVGEYIMPNWTTWSRESLLYADIVTHEDGEPIWNEPDAPSPIFDFGEPSQWQVCQALRDMGALTRPGLDIVSSVWSQTEFVDEQHWSDTERLTHEMLLALKKADLTTEDASKQQGGILYNRWQLPMYRIEFKRIEVPLAELQAERDANFWSEAGY
jgi:hypothetical protein